MELLTYPKGLRLREDHGQAFVRCEQEMTTTNTTVGRLHLSPLAGRGRREAPGEGASRTSSKRLESPPHPTSSLRSKVDLSPQAGRGNYSQTAISRMHPHGLLRHRHRRQRHQLAGLRRHAHPQGQARLRARAQRRCRRSPYRGESPVPGFRHDLFSMSYPYLLISRQRVRRSTGSRGRGRRLRLRGGRPASSSPMAAAGAFSQSRQEYVAAMNALAPGDGDAYRAAMEDVTRDGPLHLQHPHPGAVELDNPRRRWRPSSLPSRPARARRLLRGDALRHRAAGSNRDCRSGSLWCPGRAVDPAHWARPAGSAMSH